jgi:DNA-binding FadR family transcriptional regulator
MHCYKKQQKVRIFGKGCGHMYKIEGEGVVADIFKGIMKAGKRLFSNLKVKELAAATGKSLLKAGKDFAAKELVPSLKKAGTKIATKGIEEASNRIVSQIEGKPAKKTDFKKEVRDISLEELNKLKQRVKVIAAREAKLAKGRAIDNLKNLDIVEQQYEKIEDALDYTQNGSGLVRLGSSRPKKRRGRPRKSK